jgi:adenylate cyclase
MPRLTVGRLTTAVGVAVATLRLLAPWSLNLFDLKVVDLRQVLRGPLRPAPEVAIVAIDEESLSKLGRWPWPRTRTADLIAAIAREQPAAIGLDVVFDHRDEALDTTLVEEAVAAAPGRPAAELLSLVRGRGDARLDEALRNSGGAVLAYFFEIDGPPSAALEADVKGLPELMVKMTGGADVSTVDSLLAGRQVHRPLPEFTSAAGNAGHINFLPDVDGVYRRVPLAVRAGDRLFPALSLQLVRAYLGGVPLTATLSPYEMNSLILGGTPMPVNGMAQVWVNFLGPPRTFPHYSAAEVLAGRVPPGELRGRIVLVGFTASGFDDVSTPFAPVAPGVEVQATVIDNLLKHRALWRPWWSVPAETLTIVLAGMLIGVAVKRLRGVGAAMAAAGLVLWYLGATQIMFAHAGLVLGAVYPVAGIFLCALAGVAFQATREERAKRQIREAFSRYLNPEVTELVAEDPSRLRLGGERFEITVLFSDIRGFTTISEQLAPEVLGELLTEYLSAMTDIVFKHDGLLDKYVGDALMAFWGAPIAVPDHAQRACAAALEMQATVERLNVGWQERGLPHIAIGVGLNTGFAIVGNFGSERRFSYTAIGDTVNLASRLEGLNKTYGTHLLISNETLQAAGASRFACREVGEVTVRGRKGSTGVYELLGAADGVAAPEPLAVRVDPASRPG